ncbi:MASE1 domain-containing protein [Caldovatus aquaticus]|uniref:histidine kinase n=1 Tax=Caldovatus aquaticus TaxID=2865671 RepID=A0ABS7F2B5_9PROT|nr:MASE1 domain-containing protein [Caldovatus aquaticus]MBW8269745.1 MASE1 domain-containing protein [Caldovatus aquaticus]
MLTRPSISRPFGPAPAGVRLVRSQPLAATAPPASGAPRRDGAGSADRRGTAPPWPHAIAVPALVLLALFLLGYLAGVLADHDAARGPARVATFWPAAGLYLAALLIAADRRLWPPVIAAAAAANLAADVLLLGRGVPATLGLIGANALEGVLGAMLVQHLRRSRQPPRLDRLGDLLAVLAAALAAPAVGATLGAVATADVLPGAALDTWKVWWASDAVGIAVGTPVMLGLAAWGDQPMPGPAALRRRAAEAAAALALVALMSALVFWDSTVRAPVSFLALPPLLWPALRFGPGVVALAVAVLTAVAVAGTSAGYGPFANEFLPFAAQTVLLQIFLVVAAGTAHALGAAVAERRAAMRRLAQLNAELERRVAARTAELEAANARLAEGEARLRLALEGAGLGTWQREIGAGGGASWDARAAEIYGGPPGRGGAEDGEAGLRARIHPEDLPKRDAALAAALAGAAEGFAVEYRVRRASPGGDWAWVADYGAVVARDPESGAPLRLAGVVQDVSERKAAEERQALLAREVDHRAKNVLAVTKALLRLSRRDDPARFAETVEGRIDALARAHNLLAQNRWSGAELQTLAGEELAAYAGRAAFSGPPVRLAPDAAQPVAMVLHELATNAAKHGALSAAGGRVEVSWTPLPPEAGGGLRLVWAETGGPAIRRETAAAAPVPARPGGLPAPAARGGGVGARLIEQTVRHQLGGTVAMEWLPAGLRCTVVIPARRLLPNAAAPSAPAATGSAPAILSLPAAARRPD